MTMKILNLKSKILNCKKGFIFLEILIAVALIGIVFITLLGTGFLAVTISTSIQQETQADSLIKEEFEAIRSFRDSTVWTTNGLYAVNFGNANPYHMFLDTSINPARWVLQTGAETIGIFTRNIVFDKVSREPGTQNIENVYNVAYNDPNTIKATITIAWLAKTSQVVAYFTNWQK